MKATLAIQTANMQVAVILMKSLRRKFSHQVIWKHYCKSRLSYKGVHKMVSENNSSLCCCVLYHFQTESGRLILLYSPDILSSKVGQPATNCKRIFLNGFWSRNMSSITNQKFSKIRAGDVDKKQVFFS